MIPAVCINLCLDWNHTSSGEITFWYQNHGTLANPTIGSIAGELIFRASDLVLCYLVIWRFQIFRMFHPICPWFQLPSLFVGGVGPTTNRCSFQSKVISFEIRIKCGSHSWKRKPHYGWWIHRSWMFLVESPFLMVGFPFLLIKSSFSNGQITMLAGKKIQFWLVQNNLNPQTFPDSGRDTPLPEREQLAAERYYSSLCASRRLDVTCSWNCLEGVYILTRL